jgi:glycosyltransferase involved in cell wall biosynthesis
MRRILFFRAPTLHGALYFRYQQYADYLKRTGKADLRVTPPNPKYEPLLMKIARFPGRLFGQLPDILWAETIVLSPSPNMLWPILIFRLLGKHVVVEHFLSYVSHRELHAAYWTPLERWAYRLVDRVITHTTQMQEEIAQAYRIPASKIDVFYCAVDLSAFLPPVASDKHATKLQWGLQEKFVVMYHGMHHPWHGLDVLMDAARLLEADERIRFAILPHNNLPDRPNIVYLGEDQPFDRLPAFLGVADLWCSGFDENPRGDRAFSSTMIQAMAMGLPVITSPSREKRRTLEHDRNALFVPPRDPKALAEAIRRCASDPALTDRLGKASLATAREKFDFSGYEGMLAAAFLLGPSRAV